MKREATNSLELGLACQKGEPKDEITIRNKSPDEVEPKFRFSMIFSIVRRRCKSSPDFTVPKIKNKLEKYSNSSLRTYLWSDHCYMS